MGAQMRAFIWRHGTLQNMGTLGGPDSCALWINDNGQAAGHSYINSTVNPAFGFPTQDPFLWDHDKMIDLGTLGGVIGVANGLNNRGQVVGASDLEGDLTAHPFLWDRGRLMDLGTLGGTFGVATSINDGGEVVGGATNKNDQAILAFLWKKGVMTDLGTVEGDDCSVANYISSSGQIVGNSFPCAGGPSHAVLWEKGSIISLNSFVPPGSNLTLSDATFISDPGEIAVNATLPNGDIHAVLLIPVGEEDTAGVTVALQSDVVSSVPTSTNVQRHTFGPGELLSGLRTRWPRQYRQLGLWLAKP
jgi:probable HAF family extracellular repeat protein